MVRGLFLVLIAVLTASACASQQDKIDVASQIVKTDDQFLPYREYTSGALRSSTANGLDGSILVARIDRKTGALSTAVQYVSVYTHDGKYNYQSARNSRAEQLKLSVISRRSGHCSRKDGTCTHDEVLHIDIPEDALRQAPAEGYQVKLFARLGPDALITIPKQMIVSLFAKIDADRGVAAPAAQPSSAKPIASAAH